MSDSPPIVDSQADQASIASNKRPFPKHWIVLGLLVVTNAAFGTLCNRMGGILDVRDINVFMARQFVLGFVLAQPILFALWAAFAPQRFYERFLWAFLLCSVVAFVEEIGTLNNEVGLGFIMVMQLIQFMLFTTILLLIRQLGGWCLKRSQTEYFPGDYQANQFGIKHLILLTSITAVAFALIRSLLILNSVKWPPFARAVGSTLLIFAMFIPIIVVSWITMTFPKNTIKLIVLATVLFGIIDSAICLIVLQNVPAIARYYSILPPILFTQLGGCISFLFNTIMLRLCGYRMIRERKTVSSPPALGQ